MKKTILSLLVVVGLISSAKSTSLVSSTGTDGLTLFSDTIGYKFTVGSQSLSVSSLGFYIDPINGLNSAPKVGIWNTQGSLLASLNIPLNSFNDGSYIWNNLSSPITLNSSTSYLIAGFSGGSYMRSGFTITLSSDVSLVGYARNDDRYVFSAPMITAASPQVIVGPNMQYTVIPNATPSPTPLAGGGDAVPEPSTYALFGIGALALVIAYRRKVA
jgi:hypothetical protein